MDVKKSSSKEITKDRHSSKATGSTHSGSPKKGGGGGKGTWGKGGLDDLKTVSADPRDPNYDSEEEEKSTVIQKVEVQNPIEAILKEYFVEGDIAEVIRSIKELPHISFPDLIRKAMVMSMERQPFDRELVSKLLLELLKQGVVDMQMIEDGFQRALNILEDTVIDVPDAVEMLGKFLARALFDEIVPPAFLKTAQVSNSKDKEAVGIANGLITEHHKSKHLEHIWGPGDLESVKRLKQEVRLLIQEYITTGDLSEADRCVRNLNAPSFHFQLVKDALRMAMERHEDDRKKILKLLSLFAKEGLIVPDHFTQGFKACKDNLDDIKLDIPIAVTLFPAIVTQAKNEGWLSVDFN